MREFDLTHYLSKYFGYSDFRKGQKSIIEDIVAGKDVLGILPTGTGKSLCYQLPSLLLSGVTIVVSPLISLMIDQVKQLKASGYKSVTTLNSFVDQKERMRTLKNLSQYQLIYVSPEMLQNDWVRRELLAVEVSLFVVDEAHCISQWGHEFRTDYLKLHQTIADLGSPTVLALSATATPEVQKDIMKQLRKPSMQKHIYPMDKQNISFAVEHYQEPEEKVERIINVVSNNFAPTMIYFSSRQWAEKVAIELQQKVEHRVAFYHGGMEQTDRLLVQQQFMNDQLDVICCTSAFGMGVDKSNIRLVIHFHIPTQIESFIQEVGRAGRDGDPCASLVLFTPSDYHLPQMLIQSELPQESDISRVFRYVEQRVGEEGIVPEDEVVAEDLELSESQWNFMKYQLEDFGLIKGRKTQQVSVSSTEIQNQIRSLLKHRWSYKRGKLTEMVKWVHEAGCKRNKLYLPFQDEVREPTVLCCDSCGFNMNDLNFKEEKVIKESETWKSRLREIFHQGGSE